MSINIAINFSHPDAIKHRVRYARIDNTNNPSYTTVSPDPIVSPAIVATNIPNGQYQIESTPIYADGRLCNPTIAYTEPCAVLISINAYISDDNIIIQYLAPSDVPKVRITVSYPNGGGHVANYINNGSNIVIPLPPNVFGDFFISGQSVCDEGSGFYSPHSSQIVVSNSSVNVNATLNFEFINQGSFQAFQAVLDTPISSSITINRMFAEGYSDVGCTAIVAGAQINTDRIIPAGATGLGASSPETSTGAWPTAIKYTLYNVKINGQSVSHNQVLTLGNDTVIIKIPACT